MKNIKSQNIMDKTALINHHSINSQQPFLAFGIFWAAMA